MKLISTWADKDNPGRFVHRIQRVDTDMYDLLVETWDGKCKNITWQLLDGWDSGVKGFAESLPVGDLE